MRFTVTRTLIGLALAGAVGAALLPFAIYYIGLALAPPLPVPAHQPISPLLADAIWARASGGRAGRLTPITPVSMAQFAACVAIEDFWDMTEGDARRVDACRHRMPAMQGVEYLSNVHMRDAQYAPGFRTGLGRFSTTVWLTHSWTRAEFISTLAERAEFIDGLRGVDQAARILFARTPSEVSLGQAALLAAMIGDRRVDPWCDPESAAILRRRVLERMRDDGVIDDAACQSANVTELDLTRPPAAHKPCGG